MASFRDLLAAAKQARKAISELRFLLWPTSDLLPTLDAAIAKAEGEARG